MTTTPAKPSQPPDPAPTTGTSASDGGAQSAGQQATTPAWLDRLSPTIGAILAALLLVALLIALVDLWSSADTAGAVTWARRDTLYTGLFNLAAAAVGAIFGRGISRQQIVTARADAAQERTRADANAEQAIQHAREAERHAARAQDAHARGRALAAAITASQPAARAQATGAAQAAAAGAPPHPGAIDLATLARELFPDDETR